MGDRLTTIDIGRKVEGAAEPLSVGGAGSSSNTMWPWAEAYSIPNGILIHPAVWLQQIWAENWGAVAFYRGDLGPHLTHCGTYRGLPPYQVVS